MEVKIYRVRFSRSMAVVALNSMDARKKFHRYLKRTLLPEDVECEFQYDVEDLEE